MIIKGIQVAIVFLIISILVGCTGDDGDSDNSGSGNSSLDLERQSLTALADISGIASFSFTLPAGSTSFQLSASSGEINSLSAGGADLLDQAGVVSSRQNGSVTNVPYYSVNAIRAESFTASYSASPGTAVNLQVSSKSDASRSSGTLKLNIVLLGPVAGSEDIMDNLDKSLETLQITYGRAGITIDYKITSFDGPGNAPLPGDPLYQSIVDAQRPESITVVLASERKGSSSDEFEFGTIGTKPFPVVPTANSVIVISIQDITGSNETFDSGEESDEKRILGEEIGRFTAEALGLPPLVTLRGSDVTASDDIPDSPSCLSEDSCQNDASSRTNLMFPEPLEKLSSGGTGNIYYPRDQLSDQQKQVLNNSVFVD